MAGGGMSPGTAKRLAALIVANAEQLQDRADHQGVTAFLGKAVQRERPNERFLQNTLKNQASANRRADERAMWAAWEAQQQQEEQQHQGGSSVGAGGSKKPRRDARGGSHSRGLPGDRPAERGHENHSRGRQVSRGHYRSRSPRKSRSRSLQRKTRRRSSPSRTSSRRHHERETRTDEGTGTHGLATDAAAGFDDPAADGNWRLSSSSGDRVDGSSSSSMGAAAAADAAASSAPPDACASDGDAAAADDDGDGDDSRLMQWLSSSGKSVRGRGTSGPAGDVAGPYLQPPSHDPVQVQLLQQGVKKGPPKPAWMLQEQGADAARQRMAPDTGFLHGILRAQGLLARAAVGHGKAGRRVQGSGGDSSGSDTDGGSSGSSGSGGSRGNALESVKGGSSRKKSRRDVSSSSSKKHKDKGSKSKKRKKKDRKEKKNRHKHKSRD